MRKFETDIEALTFKKTGGTAAQFLKADGTIDSNAYSATTHTHSAIEVTDLRAIVDTPNTFTRRALFADFKANSANSLNDGGAYNGVLTLRKYGSSGDWSGGGASQLAFTENGNLWTRHGSVDTWGTWSKIYNDKNINLATIPLVASTVTATTFTGAGTGLTGTAASLTAGNATLASNSTKWATMGYNGTVAVSTPDYLMTWLNSDNAWKPATSGVIKSFLGLQNIQYNNGVGLDTINPVANQVKIFTSGYQPAGTTRPAGNYLVGLAFTHNITGYETQLACTTDNNLFLRTFQGGILSGWFQFWHSGNLNRSDVPFAASTGTFSSSITANKLLINSTGNSEIRLQKNGVEDWALGTQVGTGSQDFAIYNYGNSLMALSINKATNSATFSGSIVAAGEITAYSDRRLKLNIQPLTLRGDLKPVTYLRDNKKSIGFIAQDVQELYPELVKGKGDEMLSLNYQQLTAVLYAEIIDLKNRLKKLEVYNNGKNN